MFHCMGTMLGVAAWMGDAEGFSTETISCVLESGIRQIGQLGVLVGDGPPVRNTLSRRGIAYLSAKLPDCWLHGRANWTVSRL